MCHLQLEVCIVSCPDYIIDTVTFLVVYILCTFLENNCEQEKVLSCQKGWSNLAVTWALRFGQLHENQEQTSNRLHQCGDAKQSNMSYFPVIYTAEKGNSYLGN